jgi:xanthine dehydrogenase accessory factor
LATLFKHITVVVRGGGDLGSGVIWRLHRAGFAAMVTELPSPLLVRRTVSFGAAVFEGSIAIDGVSAVLARDIGIAKDCITRGQIPVLIDEGDVWRELAPDVVVDARMLKRNPDLTFDAAPLVVALGPGYEAGRDCHAVIETNRGHNLGRVYWQGRAEDDTGVPGSIGGETIRRVLRSPVAGYVISDRVIGAEILAGDAVAIVAGQNVVAEVGGILRGLVHPSVHVLPNTKVADVDPRARPEHCFSISDKALAIGGGVLEAVLVSEAVRARLCP